MATLYKRRSVEAMKRKMKTKTEMATMFSSILFLPLLLLLLLLLLPLQLMGASVIIIGAGMSGIMAAKTLSSNGVTDFLILEGTDRVGGRMRKQEFAGYQVEMGANWVEGVGSKDEVNPIWTLANRYGLKTHYFDLSNVSFNIYSQEGELLPQSVVATPYRLAEASHDYIVNLSKILTMTKEEDISIATSQRLFGHMPASPLEMVIDAYYYDFEAAEPPRVTSLKNVQPYPTFEVYGEEEHFVADKRGYVYLVHQLAKEFLKHKGESIIDSRLKLNKVVTHIDYSSDGVQVKTKDGSVYNAKYAISSVSLGVLQSKLVTFTPDLPYWKIKTIMQFDMTIYTKIFLKFPSTFWPTGPGTQFFLHAHEKRGYYPFWQHLENEYPGSNILFVTVTDDEARRIEQQSDEETKVEIMEILRTLFGKDIPQIEEILVPRWWKNQFFRGCFTNWPIGVSVIDFDRMKAPLQSLYFTGEHTSEKFNGYVHGAYLAGIDSANMLLDCMNHGKCNKTTADGLQWSTLKALEDGTLFKSKNDAKLCKGSCSFEVQKEQELMRQAWAKKANTLEEALASKCQP